MINHLTQKAQNALNHAMECAQQMGHTYIGSEHLLLGLSSTKDSIAAHLLEEHGLKSNHIKDAIVLMTGIGSRSYVSASDMTPRVQKIIESSAMEALKYGQNRVGTEHLLMALLREDAGVALHLMEECGVSVESLKRDVMQFLNVAGKAQQAALPHEHSEQAVSERAMSRKPSALDQFSRDLTALAKRGGIDPMIGREEEINRVIRTLSRRSKNNPCLVGEPGVGKTAVVEGLAGRVVRGEVPLYMRNTRILSLDMPAMLAGAKYRGEFEERLKNVLSEVNGQADIILFIDEIHTLVGAGAAEGAIDAANIVKPALARGEIRLIGATTFSEYRRYIEKDAALERRFQPIEIAPPSKEDCVRILTGLREKYEEFHQIRISDEAIAAAVDLSVRYLPERNLPDKAIDLMDEGCAMLKLSAQEEPETLVYCREQLELAENDKENAILRQDFEQAAALRDKCNQLRENENFARRHWEEQSRAERPTLLPEHIVELLRAKSGAPSLLQEPEERQRLLTLETRLSAEIYGQEEAISTLSQAIRRNRTGIRDPNRPVGSFLFAGSSGVGKTALCRVLARELFGSEESLIRLDMSEYTERHSVSRMIGSPPGYVGFDEGGQLTEQVRRHPFCVVLFDEIEKAHGDVYHLLLQILEDGVLTDSGGRHVDFKHAIIILTSNIGEQAGGSMQRSGFSDMSADLAAQRLKQERRERILRETFRPELLNRLDAILWFSPLCEEHLRQIAVNLLNQMAKRLEKMDIVLSVDESALQQLCQTHSDLKQGARPLRRAITEHIENLLANRILSGEIQAGQQVTITYQDGAFLCRIDQTQEQGQKQEPEKSREE